MASHHHHHRDRYHHNSRGSREHHRDYEHHSRDYRRDGRNNNNSERNRGGRYKEDRKPPSCTLILRNLSFKSTDASLYYAFEQFKLLSTHVVIDRDTGRSRGFGFLQFQSIEEATSALETFGGTIWLDGRDVSIEFCEDRQGSTSTSTNSTAKVDWICETCCALNFSRRVACFKCQAPRTETSIEVPQHPVAQVQPSNTLSVRSMPLGATEADLEEAFKSFSVENSFTRVIRDRDTNISKGFGFVQFLTTEVASTVLAKSKEKSVCVQGVPVEVEFSKEVMGKCVIPSTVSRNEIAAAAMQQAQWSLANRYQNQEVAGNNYITQQEYTYSSTNNSNFGEEMKADLEKVQASGTVRPRKEWPSCFETSGANYVLDPQTGFYYEAASGFYYDITSKLYYGSFVNKYYRYIEDVSSTTPSFIEFIPPVPIDNAVAPSRPSEDEDAVRSLKQEEKQKAKRTISFGIKIGGSKNNSIKQIEKWTKVQQAEKKTTNKQQHNCLLCRRRFNSAEQLVRHETKSALHQENLEKNRAKEANDYRDRAKERRETIGEDFPQEQKRRKLVPSSTTTTTDIRDAASVNKPVGDSNIGSILLQKMGWKKGCGLGKNEDGIKNPIQAIGQLDGQAAGLGSCVLTPIDTTSKSKSQKIQARYYDKK